MKTEELRYLQRLAELLPHHWQGIHRDHQPSVYSQSAKGNRAFPFRYPWRV